MTSRPTNSRLSARRAIAKAPDQHPHKKPPDNGDPLPVVHDDFLPCMPVGARELDVLETYLGMALTRLLESMDSTVPKSVKKH